jgi:hypothetical protein
MYFLYKNEYRISNLLKSQKKGTKVERREMEGRGRHAWVVTHLYTEVSQ